MLRHVIYSLAFVLNFTTAQAEPMQSYLGFNFVGFEEESINDLDDVEGNGYSIFYGFRVDETIIVEAAFSQYEYDDYHQEIVLTESETEGVLTIQGDTQSLEVAVLFQKQLQSVSPFLAFGYMDYDGGDATARRMLNDGSDIIVSGSSQSETYFGFGVDLPIPDNPIVLRLSHKIVGGDIDADFTSFGALINF